MADELTPMRDPSADWADTCADTPNWRDNPDELQRLCELGAQQLHGHARPADRDIDTVRIEGDLL